MSKILIMGGTGAIGVYLAPELLEDGHEVHVTTRSDRKNGDGRLRYIRGDASDPKFIGSLTAHTKYDAIIDLMTYETAEFQRIHQRLLERTGHYLFVSSYRVFADTGTAPVTERSPRLLDVCKDREYLATDEYALAKARQENLLRASGKSNWTIMRPCISYSKNRFQFGTLEANTICLRALQGVPVIMAREVLSKHTTMTWAGDVARLMAKLTLNENARGEDFNVVTREHHTWEQIGAYYQEFIGLETVPVELDLYTQVVGNRYQVQYDRLVNRILDNSKVLGATGLEQTSFTGTKEGLKRELESFKKKPFFQYPDITLNARMDNATGSSISLQGLGLKEKLRYFFAKHGLMQKLRDARSKLKACLGGQGVL